MKRLILAWGIIVLCAAQALAVKDTTITLPDGSEIRTVDSVEVPYEVMMDSVFKNLDFSEVTSHHLMDKGFEFIDVSVYDGTIGEPDPAKTLTYNHLMQVYGSLYTAAVDSTERLPHPGTVADEVNGLWSAGYVPLMLIDYNYHVISEDAIDNNLLYIDGMQLFDVEEREESPYVQKRVFAAGVAAFTSSHEVVNFILPSNLVFTNTGETITKIEVDFDDGQGFVEVYQDVAIPIEYEDDKEGTEPRTLNITVRITSSGINYLSGSSMQKKPPMMMRYADIEDDFFDLESLMGEHAGARVSIAYGCGNNRLMKPLIVVPGFDPIGYEILGIDARYFDFWRSMPEALRTELENEGYDLVYIDYNNGGDDLQRNAQLVKDVIRWAIAELDNNNSESQISVLGESMGGLVAKIALREMEIDNEEHRTELFMAHDSPFRGANVAMGYQALLVDLAHARIGGIMLKEIVPEIRIALDNVLHTTAAYQLLWGTGELYQLQWHKTVTIETSTHAAFQLYYHGLGNLTQVERVVAISSGSEIAQGQQFPAHSVLLNIDPPLNSIFFMLNLENWQLALVTILGVTNSTDIEVRALPDRSWNWREIYNSRIVKTVLWFIPITVHHGSMQVRNMISYDIAPGGFVITPDPNMDGINLPQTNFCYNPSVSSLNIDPAAWAPDLFYDIQSADIVGSGETDFMDYAADQTPGPAAFDEVNNRHLDKEPLYVRTFMVNEFTTIRHNTFLSSGAEFNFGQGTVAEDRTTDRLGSVFIQNFSKLHVNGNLPVGTPGAGLSSPVPGSQFDVYTRSQSCEAVTVNLQSGTGAIIIGSSSPDDNIGNLYMTSGTTFNMNAGTLTIHDNSSLIIEEGATFIFNGGNIELLGDNAVIEIRGNLEINGNFTFTGSGYIHFNHHGSFPSANVTYGINSSINLSGSGMTDLVLKISQETLFMPDENSIPNFSFNVEDAMIVMGDLSRISLPCSVSMNNVNIIAEDPAKPHRGLYMFGQKYASLSYLYIFDGLTGIHSNQTFNANPTGLTCTDCSFTNCETGINITGRWFNLLSSYFSGCETAIYATGMTGTSKSELMYIINSEVGVDFTGSSGSVLDLDCPTITAFDIGAGGTGTELQINDGDIHAGTIGLYVANNATLMMSDPEGNTQVSAVIPIHLFEADDIDLDNPSEGRANKITGTSSFEDIYGSLRSNYPGCPTVSIEADFNDWNGSLTTDVSVMCGSSWYPVTFTDANPQSGVLAGCGNLLVPTFNDNTGAEQKIIDWAGQKLHMKTGYDTLNIFALADILNQFGETDSSHTNIDMTAIAYRLLMKKLDGAIASGSISVSDSVVSPEIAVVFNVIDSLENRNSGLAQSHGRHIQYNIDKASLHRQMGNRAEALAILNYLSPSLAYEHVVSKWYCLISAEKDYLDSLITLDQFDSAMTDCKVNNEPAQISRISLNISEQKEESVGAFTIYPNPAQDYLNVVFKQPLGSVKVEVMDITGRILNRYDHQTSEKLSISINTTKLVPGTYFLKVYAEGTEIEIEKFLIIK